MIIHFQPIELYPPALNILEILANESRFNEINVISFKSPYDHSYSPCTSINYMRVVQSKKSKWIRFFTYLDFYIRAIACLLKKRPKQVLYFESISAFPAVFYKFFFRNSRIFVHYHEYTSPLEYKKGMLVNRYSHELEKSFYPSFDWISHTNKDRIRMFAKDVQLSTHQVVNEMPNFPPKSWGNSSKRIDKPNIEKTKFVYIGAISFEDTYLKEMIDYVATSEYFELEIFAFSAPDCILNYIYSNGNNRVRYSGRIEYNDIPCVLNGKEIGLVLYKGNTLNFTYNAPNKLFEYLVCGLDVWYPKEMIGCKEIQESNPYRVFSIDFLQIKTSTESSYFLRTVSENSSFEYTANQATRQLLESL